MKKILTILLAVLTALPSFARDFSYEYKGQTLTYTVLDEEAKTCQTKAGGEVSDSPGNIVSGVLIIPEIAKDGNTEYKVTEIGHLAFSNCSDLTAIEIPTSVKTIGTFAFLKCNGLNSVKIPDSVETISQSAFSLCTGLTSVEIPGSVTTIGDDAFYGCSGLTSVEIPNSITELSRLVFENCTGLTSVTIPNSVTYIDSGAFKGCSSLASITIPGSVNYVGSSVFQGCSSMTSFTVADGETDIYLASRILEGAPIESLYLGRSWSGDGWYSTGAIGDRLKSVTFGKQVQSVPSMGFNNCNAITSVNACWEKPIWVNFNSINMSEAILDIPENTLVNYISSRPWCYFQNISVGGKMTKLFSDSNFKYRLAENSNSSEAILIAGDYSTVTEANIPEYVTVNSDSGNSVRYYVTAIGLNAFRDCTGLTSVKIPGSVTIIGDDAFGGCSGLTSVEVPNSITYIGDSAFENCSSLSSVTIPGSVTSISYGTFQGCSSLTSVIIPNSVTSIGEWSFSGCSSLTSVTISNSVTSIGNSAFYGCSSLTSVKIPNSVTSIDSATFRDCSSLTSVEIPNSVTSIGNSAFQGCSSLTSVEIPNLVTSIGTSAFSGCSSLTSVEIPNSVTFISGSAFSDCSGLTSVKIPGSVTTIGSSAFVRCDNLTSVYYNSEDPVEFKGRSIFTSYDTATLYVPETAVEKCKLIAPWKNFNSIRAHQFDGIEDITVDNNLPCEIYNLSGVKVADATEGLTPGLYIVRQGSNVKKISVK